MDNSKIESCLWILTGCIAGFCCCLVLFCFFLVMEKLNYNQLSFNLYKHSGIGGHFPRQKVGHLKLITNFINHLFKKSNIKHRSFSRLPYHLCYILGTEWPSKRWLKVHELVYSVDYGAAFRSICLNYLISN